MFAQLTLLQEAQYCISDADQHPADMAFHLRAAIALSKAGLNDAAVSYLDAAISRIGPSRAALQQLAECLDSLGRVDRAREMRAASAKLP